MFKSTFVNTEWNCKINDFSLDKERTSVKQ